jgi:proline iminopeptidase
MNVYSKTITPHPEFYITKFTRNPDMPYLLFIHGGPGFNCGIVEYLIEHHKLFDLLDYNIVLYDQRNCGRSKNNSTNVLHQDNVTDLHNIIQYLIHSIGITINGLIGHSYGAKLLFDYYNTFASSIPAIFVSTARSIITPRLNNLMIDLSYLKKFNPRTYNEILQEMDNLNLEKIWEISEKLTPLFQENKDRPYLYWANLDSYEMITRIQSQINLPMNAETFVSVRKDLYSNEEIFSVSIEKLNVPYLWINGFHDFIMNGANGISSKNKNIITFFQSSHYPHIEENNRFSELINNFIKKSRTNHA